MDRQPYVIECRECGTEITVLITEQELFSWQSGTFVQKAFPTLTADERELFISRTCGVCFEKMFPPPEF